MLELLSPSNKTGPDRAQYLSKRDDILRQEVHWVELDLLLGGRRLPIGGKPAGHFYAILSRFEQRWEDQPTWDVYAWSLRDHLPRLPIPLLLPDPDIFCDLSAVYAQSFERGRYARDLKYAAPPEGALPEDGRRWVESCVSAKNVSNV